MKERILFSNFISKLGMASRFMEFQVHDHLKLRLNNHTNHNLV